MGLFRSKRPRFTIQQMLAAKPVRLVAADLVEAGEGRARLTVPLQPAKWAGWLLRVPRGSTKTFELDPLGMLVWKSVDGKTSVQQIIRRLSRQYNLNVRESQVATIAFLNTLTRKGLVGMQMRKRDQAEEKESAGKRK
jgi:hypothetical protein